MRRNLGSLATLALALPLLIWLGGCGGAGGEKTSSVSTSTSEASTPSKEKGGGEPAELVTPERVVDIKKAVDVVKEELKGGEESLGPSPQDVLSQDPDSRLIKDEPLEISGPPVPGLQSLIAYIPPANPLTRGKVELGKQLYFDPRISLDGTVSCATCHNPEKGWTDRLKTSIGIYGQAGARNAPTVLNTVYGKSMFWDGRAPSLEGQSQGPPQNPIEMGRQSYKQIVDRLRTISGYHEQFQKVFGTDVTLDGIAKAIASFERVAALSGNSKYDKYVAGDFKALSDSEKRGMVLFGIRLDQDDDFKTDVVLQKARCTLCHAGFNFTDEQFHNLGIGWDEKRSKFADLGRYVIDPIGAKNPADKGAFKTPTVRDVSRTAPYMHDGSLKTLEDVVEHYDKGGNANPFLDKDMRPLKLTAQEQADLVAFMKALTGEELKVALPTLPVGPDGKSPDPRSALKTPAPKAAWNVFHPSSVR
ncbi:MAG: cytochrome-c peroxidase [Singulisphaera sp.]|nr:cytochrome-c peroxidase [Singulisphaera sp.]